LRYLANQLGVPIEVMPAYRGFRYSLETTAGPLGFHQGTSAYESNDDSIIELEKFFRLGPERLSNEILLSDIDATQNYARRIAQAVALAGPRGTGKSTWLHAALALSVTINPPDESLEQAFLADPGLFAAELRAPRPRSSAPDPGEALEAYVQLLAFRLSPYEAELRVKERKHPKLY